MLICFDIDGTLADINHRVHYWRDSPKNWNMFKAEMVNDTTIEQICSIAREMWSGGHIVILCTGRGEENRKVTADWLLKHGIEYNELYMRLGDDRRGDDIVKKELLDKIVIEFGQKPDIWFDDRPRVVKMLRENGVFVVDVYQGTEDF
jgi:uncharacterized HAD superfamily protein